jgi:hypothetical protein
VRQEMGRQLSEPQWWNADTTCRLLILDSFDLCYESDTPRI